MASTYLELGGTAGGGGGGSVTWADDLATSTDTSQIVSGLTGDSNLVTVPATTNLRFASSAVATTGRLRFPNNQTIIGGRIAADSANAALLTWSNTNQMLFGESTNVAECLFSAANGYTVFVGGNYCVGGTATTCTLYQPTTVSGGYIQFPTNPAASGCVRVPNATVAVAARNAANTEDIAFMNISNLNEVEFGKYNPSTQTSLYFYAHSAGSVNFYSGTTNSFHTTGSYTRFLVPEMQWRPSGTTDYPVASYRNTVQTTDATTTTLATHTQADTCVCRYAATVTGYEPATGDCFSTEVTATYYRNGGGATLVGSIVASNRQERAGAATWAVTFDTSTNDVRVRVTGEAAHTINWRSTLTVEMG